MIEDKRLEDCREPIKAYFVEKNNEHLARFDEDVQEQVYNAVTVEVANLLAFLNALVEIPETRAILKELLETTLKDET